MGNRRSHNSILFLTTLGVYLGLVLVGGAAPSTFAHAAMTRNFEIADEIEIKDDLDKKPDDPQESKANQENENGLRLYAQILGDMLDAERRSGVPRLDFSAGTYPVVNASPGVDLSFNGVPLLLRGGTRARLESDLRRILSLFPPVTRLVHENFGFDWTSQSDALSIKSTLDFQNDFDAHYAFARLNTDKTNSLNLALSIAANAILKATEIKRANNQVFIVTRLPRGSIDSHLAANAK